MAKPVQQLLKKVSSVSAAAATLLAGVNAAGSSTGDPDTAKRTQEALDALKRSLGADADQVRFHAGGQLDPQTQEILLAGHSSHSSHVSGSYIRGGGSGDDSGSTYTPAATPSYSPSTYTPASTTSSESSSASTTTTSAPSAPPAAAVNITYRSGTHLAGSIIQRGSWGLQLLLKDTTRIQIPRRKLRAEDITTLELPAPKAAGAPDVPAMVYLRLNDGTNYTGQVTAADGEKVTLTADDKTSQTFQREQMDGDTFLALQGLTPDTPPPLAPTTTSATGVPPATKPVTPVIVGQQVLIKLNTGTKMLVTLLSKTDTEITVRTKDGHNYLVPAARLSRETLVALQMPSLPDATTAPKHKKT